jgi:glycosyltransferase involved in cell wall biosynthesis
VRDQITPVILTRDEAPNIGRTLAQLAWAKEVLVVDSFSTDDTLEIARTFPNVRVLQRPLDDLAAQSAFGVAQSHTPWVLLLDADYFVTEELVRELATLEPAPGVYGFIAAFDYAIGGRRLRASLYPARVVLLHRDHSELWQDGHTPRIRILGDTAVLRGRVVHDDRKSFRRFLQRQRRYMRQEASKLHTTSNGQLNLPGRIRKLIFVAPFAVLVHTLFVKRLALDGLPGLHYTAERVVAETILSTELLRRTASIAVRLPLRLVPRDRVRTILFGPLKGWRWISGSATHSAWLGTYEKPVQRLFKQLVKPGMIVFDVGANVGF